MCRILALAVGASLPFLGFCDFVGAFEKGLRGWKASTGGNAFCVREYEKRQALVVTRAPENDKGTAWELESDAFAVAPGQWVSLVVAARSTFKELRFLHGFRGKYITGIRWYDAEDKPLPLAWGCGLELEQGAWRRTVSGTEVPRRAAKARVCLGFDTPNFGSNDVFAVSEVRVLTAHKSPAKDRVTLRDDGFVLIGGKPFFPIGIYAVSECELNGNSIDRALQDLKAAGFNLVHRTRPVPLAENDAFLSLADRHGLKVFAQPVASYDDDFVEKSLLKDQVEHPCVLAWYLADDTASHVGPETVALRDRIVKAMDADRLTLQADVVLQGSTNCRYDTFVHASDVFLPEIYPVREKEPDGSEVAEVIRDMRAIRESLRKAGNPKKSIWPICQHFDGWGGWKRFPTFAELRAMSWASLIHGGHGITWYVYHSQSGRGRGVASDPARFAEIAAVTKEISALSDDLLTRTPGDQPVVTVTSGPQTDAWGGASVTALLKGGDAPLLMSVNSTTNVVRATIAVRGFAKADVIGEGRELGASAGVSDVFGPYAVHLYRLKK